MSLLLHTFNALRELLRMFLLQQVTTLFLAPNCFTYCMAPDLLCDSDLSGSLRMSQAVQPSDDPTELCDYVFDSLAQQYNEM